MIGYFLVFLFTAFPLMAVPPGRNLGDQRSSVDSVKHELNNHETELRMLSERIDNQENIIETLRNQLTQAHQTQKEWLEGSSHSSTEKMASLETANKSLLTDLKQLKTHANESATTLTNYKQKIVELEKAMHAQSQTIDDLKEALKSLMGALEIKDHSFSDKDSKTYKIKSGDRLDKIAKAHNTSVKAIKELNHLTNDLIREGQTLKIP